MKTLKIWNGRAYGVTRSNRSEHVYVAAYSVADIQRLCVELGLYAPATSEVKVYWNAGAWGNRMKGIEIERGVWLQSGEEEPKRVLAKSTCESKEKAE